MFLLRAVALIVLGSLALAQDSSLAEVRRAFNAANIPADASLAFNPTSLLEVTFPQASGPPVRVHAGIQLPRNQTAIPPTFALQRARGTHPAGRGPFVLAMVDLDAPTPQAPTSAQIRHFLGANFRALAGLTGLAPLRNDTPALSGFLQPTPPAGSDPHRYVFLLFDQPAGFNQQTLVNATTSIANFNISAFAQATGLGRVLGGSFILVGPDPTTA